MLSGEFAVEGSGCTLNGCRVSAGDRDRGQLETREVTRMDNDNITDPDSEKCQDDIKPESE
jgi:hypothetical protein